MLVSRPKDVQDVQKERYIYSLFVCIIGVGARCEKLRGEDKRPAVKGEKGEKIL